MGVPSCLLLLLKEEEGKFHGLKENMRAVCRNIPYSIVARRDKSLECYDLLFLIIF